MSATQPWPGHHEPLGATWTPASTNFAVHAPEATAVTLCLLDDDGVETRYALRERTLGIWHAALPGVPVGQRYGFRVDGPWDPDAGASFNSAKLVVDPYAKAISGSLRPEPAVYGYHRALGVDDADVSRADLARRDDRDSAPYVPHAVVVDAAFDWEDDAPPRTRWSQTSIYELHVKGFSALGERIPPPLRGTYAGLAHPESLAYLTGLGVSAVELLPVHEFVTEPFVAARGMTNYWGYNSLGFFAPHHAYAVSGDRGEQVAEFKSMVKALHAAGIEVILDVVYNHTGEGGRTGPTLSLRGLDERGSYRRDDAGRYVDLTGCGNTVDVSQPATLRLVLDSLRYWVNEMHVDGFRFDLASALARTGLDVDLEGAFLQAVGQDPVLRRVKLIAEPWDATGEGYLVGLFPPPWCEWNDRYRDTVRDFWRTGSGGVRDVASRLAGSSDLYADDGRSPYASVNFVTAHDGFTLRDLLSYDQKHNQSNGEHDRDGSDHNRSWNHGVEGETDDPEIVALRRRQAANVMATLCLSAGVPMITAGDERGRTQGGNNNPYVQDNEVSWLDWSEDGCWPEVYDVARTALRLRRDHPTLRQRHHFEGRPTVDGGPKDLAWLHPTGRELTEADWHDPDLHTVGMFVSGDPLRERGPHGEVLHDTSFLLWFHARPEPVTVHFPRNDWVHAGEIVLSTDPSYAVGRAVAAGEQLTLTGRSVLVVRERAT